MRDRYGLGEVFLVPSGTAALEMGALLADLKEGDEVILPSYTFSSTANAIVLRGARPVFCEVEPDTLNVDVADVEARITPRTRMILPIDYAGHPCAIRSLRRICEERSIVLMQDAAQSLHSSLDGKWAGSEADLVAFSFHETKNITCGEGGALVVNRPEWVQRARFLQEKGTDRSLVLKGLRSKYQWVDTGSSFLLADILAAMLLAQLEEADSITERRALSTTAYGEVFAPVAKRGAVRVLRQPQGSVWNHHAFVVLFDSEENQVKFLAMMNERKLAAYIGYMPLHSSPMGASLGYRPEDLPRTQDLASRVVRMPLFTDMTEEQRLQVVEGTREVLARLYGDR